MCACPVQFREILENSFDPYIYFVKLIVSSFWRVIVLVGVFTKSFIVWTGFIFFYSLWTKKLEKKFQKKNNVKHSWFDGYWFFELPKWLVFKISFGLFTPAMIYRKISKLPKLVLEWNGHCSRFSNVDHNFSMTDKKMIYRFFKEFIRF